MLYTTSEKKTQQPLIPNHTLLLLFLLHCVMENVYYFYLVIPNLDPVWIITFSIEVLIFLSSKLIFPFQTFIVKNIPPFPFEKTTLG